ncbi:MAG: HAD family hydrolase [Clostridia bacterium]|nr:HAD family hydrolase [Clostridia bacterium]
MITTVLFDLDGTLLPMDQDVFVKCYFGLLAKRLAPLGYEPEPLIAGIWAGTAAMVKNDGSKLNEEAFWDDFAGRFGEKAREDLPHFDAFYREDFDQVQQSCGCNPKAAETVKRIKEMGFRVALATNPIFPAVATEKRIRWAGLQPEDFELYTTYKNSTCSKPNPAYYKEVVGKLGVTPEECLMVGNDVAEDMVAAGLGMKVFLLTDCIINKKNEDISRYPQGGFDELMGFLGALE